MWIAKAVKCSYKQARYALDKLVRDKKVERWTVYCGPCQKKSYLRVLLPGKNGSVVKDSAPVDKSVGKGACP